MDNSQEKILIVGVVPPPIGGVSIHLSRLYKRVKSHGINVSFWDYSKDTLLEGAKKVLKAGIVHTNFSNKLVRCISTILLKLLNKKVIVTFHGKYSFLNFFDIITLKLVSKGLILNDYSFRNAIKKTRYAERIELISAFIPPDESEIMMPKESNDQLKVFRERYKFIACSNAHNYVVDSDGKDLYGIDFLLTIFSALKEKGLVISDPSGKLFSQYANFHGLSNILFISEPHSFVEIIKISDVVVRATTSDGDSLSVKEALYFGKRVIASDCVDRPIECEIYKVNDENSFKETLFAHRESQVKSIITDGTDQIVRVYRDCQTNKNH